MGKLLMRKMFRDMRRAKTTYIMCAFIVAIGFCGYSVLELCYENLEQSKKRFMEQSDFCDGFVECQNGTAALIQELERIPGVAKAEGRLVKDVRVSRIAKAGERPEEVSGEDVELHLVSWKEGGMNRPVLSEGMFPSAGRREVVVGEGIAKTRGLRPGDTVSLVADGKQTEMEITGIGITPENIYMIREGGELFPSPASYDAAFTSPGMMEGLFGMEGRINSCLIRLEPGTDWETLELSVEQAAELYGMTASYGREDQTGVAMVGEEIKQLSKMSSVIPFLFLTVAGVILYISLSRMVEQQRTQAGTMMALGISGLQIRLHYMWYGLAVGLAGGMAGGILGYVLAGPMADFYRVYFNLPDADAPLSFVYLAQGNAAAGFFCGGTAWFTAGRIGKLEPATALRPPVPMSAGHSVLERIPGFRLLFTIPGMMAVRGLSRNRKRTALSIAGIAFAYMITATLVSMNGMFDIYIFDYWEKTQRQDLTVRFVRPMPEKAALEAVRHPDLEIAEPALEFPAVLSGPEGKTECAVQTIDSESKLCLLYRPDGSRARVQEQGIVLTEHMARKLGVRAGGMIQLKATYPEEKITRVPVTDVIAQYMGNTAYMSESGARDAGGFSDACSMVLLKAPAETVAELRERLDEADGVGMVESRQGRLNQYRALVGSVGSMMASMAALGMIITVAVVYISSLICYEEQKRELAALMMLGFTGRECLDVIAVGQWITALAAVGLGIPMAMAASRLVSETMGSDLYTIPNLLDGTALAAAAGLTAAAVWAGSAITLRRLKRLMPAELLRERE